MFPSYSRHPRATRALERLRISARPAMRPALFPQLFPIPYPGRHLNRQRESELIREHTHLPAMVGFVRKHVADTKCSVLPRSLRRVGGRRRMQSLLRQCWDARP
jgi:hypothetical protein